MFVYWLMFAIPALAAVSRVKLDRQLADLSWLFVALLFILIIGFRWEIGRDWELYYINFNRLRGSSLMEGLKVFNYEDSAYVLISWIMSKMGFGISGLNLFCATVFIAGLFSFCRQQPEPWLALVVAIPFLVIVVAMGYTRQSVALGFVFFALGAIAKRRVLYFVFFVALAAFFHKSAMLFAPIGILVATSKRSLLMFMLFLLACLFLKFQSWERSLEIVKSYTDIYYPANFLEAAIEGGSPKKGMFSPGAYMRVAMNVFPAIIFLMFWKRFRLKAEESSLWIWMSIIAISGIPQLVLMTSSTIVDRMAIYFVPVQLFVYSRFQCLFRVGVSRQLTTALVIGVYAIFQFIWFNYGNNSFAWVPYQF